MIPQHGCGERNNNALIHRCDIQRATVAPVTAPITDRKITKWGTIKQNARCWFDDGGKAAVRNRLLGQVPVGRWTVWFAGGTDVLASDRLRRVTRTGAIRFYEVESVTDHVDEGGMCIATVVEKNFAMGQ